MAAAAQANKPMTLRYEFKQIASKCKQAQVSLAVGGDGDAYQLWYLGFLSLLHHCTDGAAYAHEISKGDPRYDPGKTDAAMARLVAEKAAKDFGPPKCSSFDGWRPGVCSGCPHFGKIVSPWTLGAEDGDLPEGYRRQTGWVERRKKGMDGGEFWAKMLRGDVFAPVLDWRPNGYALTFTYEADGQHWPVLVEATELPSEAGALRKYFSPKHITLHTNESVALGDFAVAWIKKLQEMRAERGNSVPPFGYVVDDTGSHIGLAIGGTLYKADGTEEAAPGGDASIMDAYKPHGNAAAWRTAFDLVCANRPDLQVLVAASFGAPLMHFTGHAAVVVSAWSADSGVGKSSALKVGQAVWSSPKMMNSLDDTPNSVNSKMSTACVIPSYWDEMRVGKDFIASMVNNLFAITQGKEKSRLRADTSMRNVGEWETIVIAASNTPFMEHVVNMTDGTDAGALRLFEYKIEPPRTTLDSQAQATIKATQYHYGSVGRVYAKYVSENVVSVSKQVMDFSDALRNALAADTSERFFVAGMACMLVGARTANQLNLTSFDVRAMYDFMKHVFLDLRAARKRDLMQSNGVMDIESVLSMFVSDFTSSKIITNRFSRQGPKGDFKIEWAPDHLNKIDVQIAQANQTMRINRVTFYDWCRRRNYGRTEIMTNLKRTLGAYERRATLGDGTGYAGGQLWVIDVPLSTPTLQSYLYLPLTTQAPAPARATVQPGNRPKV